MRKKSFTFFPQSTRISSLGSGSTTVECSSKKWLSSWAGKLFIRWEHIKLLFCMFFQLTLIFSFSLRPAGRPPPLTLMCFTAKALFSSFECFCLFLLKFWTVKSRIIKSYDVFQHFSFYLLLHPSKKEKKRTWYFFKSCGNSGWQSVNKTRRKLQIKNGLEF